ncbi:MAG: hypothetical protein KatS3mg088_283 [Patescibacteria group bacterium]|nr:MAG: hypothetical protein KatS3mg088_283 [Patescibacteria group bacterium]
MKKIFLIFLSLIFAVVLGGLLVGGYFGVVPYFSSLFGSDKPRDLGVPYTKEDFDSYIKKVDYQLEKSKSVNSPLGVDFSGEVEIKQTLTKEEVSARLNYAPWKYMPIKNVQVNFPEKDTVEFSANLLVERIPEFLSAVGFSGVSQEDIDKGLKYVKAVNPPIYAKGKVSVSENKVDVNLISVEVGRIPVPFEDYDGNKIVKTVAERIFSLVPNFYAKSVVFSPEGMFFEGKAPTKGAVLE